MRPFELIAGPCAVESREMIIETAKAVKRAGATALRGGAYKPRTHPDSFRGLGVVGLDYLEDAADETNLPLITEVLSEYDVEVVSLTADVIQIGSRNMQNFALLDKVGRVGMPVLLKRGIAATIDEVLGAVEYVRAGGCEDVTVCERGIRAFPTETRFTLDVAAVPLLQREGLRVIVDPSHAAGRRDLVLPLALAGVAAGADGIIVEVHPHPEHALSDSEQQLPLDWFKHFADDVLDAVACSPLHHRGVGK